MDNNKKYLLVGAVIIGGFLLYRQQAGGSAAVQPTGSTMAPEVANSPYLAEVQTWIAQTGTAAAQWTAALQKFSLDELQKLHTMIYEVWPKYDPYKYFFDEAHTLLAGDWFMSLKGKYSIA